VFYQHSINPLSSNLYELLTTVKHLVTDLLLLGYLFCTNVHCIIISHTLDTTPFLAMTFIFFIFYYFFLSFFFFKLYSYVHTRLGSFLPPSPCPLPPPAPSLSPPTPSLPDRNYFALISNFVVERV
jgi:hypothetical protein